MLLYSYKKGRISSPETDKSPYREVHMLYDHVPDVLRPPTGAWRTKWVFLTSIATTRQNAYDAYKEGDWCAGLQAILTHSRDYYLSITAINYFT